MKSAHNDDDIDSEKEPETQTESDGGSGRKGLTRVGSAVGGSGGDGGRFRQFGEFDPRSDVPKGKEFLECMKKNFPDLSPTVMRHLDCQLITKD